MKKILCFAFAVAAFASCAKSEMASVVDAAQSGQMKFAAYSNESLAGATRGVDVDNTNIADNGNAIGIYAYGSTDLIVDASLSNHKLYSDNGVWTSATTSYWKTNTVYNFYAYYPYVTATATTDTQIISDFTAVPYSAASQTDVLYTGVKNVTTGGDISKMAPVALAFKHALAKADFKISVTDDSKLTVNSLRIEGLSTAHTGLALASGFANTVVADCSQDGARAYYYGTSQNFASAIEITSEESVVLSTATAAGAFYLLPQFITPWSIDPDSAEFHEGARLVINYTLENGGDVVIPDADSGKTTQDAAFPIPVIKDNTSGEIIGLQEGKSYVFTLEFAATKNGGVEPETGEEINPEDKEYEISFSVSVNPWVDYAIEIPLN